MKTSIAAAGLLGALMMTGAGFAQTGTSSPGSAGEASPGGAPSAASPVQPPAAPPVNQEAGSASMTPNRRAGEMPAVRPNPRQVELDRRSERIMRAVMRSVCSGC